MRRWPLAVLAFITLMAGRLRGERSARLTAGRGYLPTVSPSGKSWGMPGGTRLGLADGGERPLVMSRVAAPRGTLCSWSGFVRDRDGREAISRRPGDRSASGVLDSPAHFGIALATWLPPRGSLPPLLLATPAIHPARIFDKGDGSTPESTKTACHPVAPKPWAISAPARQKGPGVRAAP